MATKYTAHCSSTVKDQELNVYVTYIFCTNNCPELHLHLQSLALKCSLALLCLQHTKLMASSQNAAKGQGVMSQQCQKLKPLTAEEVQQTET